MPVIVIGQVLATSTWFAANAVARDIGRLWSQGEQVGQITLMVQLGFIAGTLIVSTTGLSDALACRRLFCLSALAAAVTNAAILAAPSHYVFVLSCRFMTGLALAGVYPIGMKLAASWYAVGLGRALGYLVGALVFGTSLTHLLRAIEWGPSWQTVIVSSSLAAALGGFIVLVVRDGPYLKRSSGQRPQLSQLRTAWAVPDFRRAALAYFGHMWELYTFWAFMPRWIEALELPGQTTSLCCFLVIAVGTVGCVCGGLVAQSVGSRKVARFYLALSGACCVLSPLIFHSQDWVVLLFLFLWGVAVVGDSPQLSSLNALAAPREIVGSALTATTCIGFSITVVSLLLLDELATHLPLSYLFLPLALGPWIGWWYLRKAF